MTAGVHASTTPLAPLVDESRLGSSLGQAATGIAGIVLAVVLVMGQISLATTAGLAAHLHQAVENMEQGNQVMESVIERSAPSPLLAKAVEEQSKTLASTRDTMRMTNAGMAGMASTATKLDGVVGRMETTSGKLATGLDGMGKDTTKMSTLLGTLPAQATKTQTALGTINTDTKALNVELAAIAAKMQGYGLPRAQGAPRA